jgi:hypothetical protein
MLATRILHQFPISHYCEKTRWNLDAKQLEYRVKNQLPGPHANVRVGGQRFKRSTHCTDKKARS